MVLHGSQGSLLVLSDFLRYVFVLGCLLRFVPDFFF